MKRMFEIEFPDDYGEMWMNQDNLMLCINAYCENKNGAIKVTDVTNKVAYLSEDQSLPDNPFIAENEYSQHGWEESPRFVNYQKAQQAMLKAGWWKVKLEEKDGAKKGD